MPNLAPNHRGKMDTREEDYKLINEGLRSDDRNDRRQAIIAQARINGESRDVRKKREALVKAHRERDRGKIEELNHELYVEGRRVRDKVERYYRGRPNI